MFGRVMCKFSNFKAADAWAKIHRDPAWTLMATTLRSLRAEMFRHSSKLVAYWMRRFKWPGIRVQPPHRTAISAMCSIQLVTTLVFLLQERKIIVTVAVKHYLQKHTWATRHPHAMTSSGKERELTAFRLYTTLTNARTLSAIKFKTLTQPLQAFKAVA